MKDLSIRGALVTGLRILVIQGFVLTLVYLGSTLADVRELRRWESGDGQYALAVVERRPYLDLLGWHARTMFVVGRKGAVPGYGHPKDYSFIHAFPDREAYLRDCMVEWSEEGATFMEPAGHRLFFPRDVYSSGR